MNLRRIVGVRSRKSARRWCRLNCEQLEDRTVPSVTAIEAPLQPSVADGDDAITILEPIPAVVAGVSPDSPALRVDPNTTASLYGGVVSLSIQTTMGNYICSGTAVSPTHIVSAAHCLDIDNDGDSDEILRIIVNFNYDGNLSQQIEAASWVIHPDWTGFNNPSINDDVSVITLAEELDPGVPFYPLYEGNIAGQALTLVGYGLSGTPSGYTGGASFTVKRVGQNVVGAFVGQDDGGQPAANEIWRADFDGPDATTNTLGDGLTLGNDTETTLGGGDSGGPAFINVNGQLYLAGINTHTAAVIRGFFQIINPPAYATILGGINVSVYADWINDIIDAAPDTTPPAAPTDLTATAGNNRVTLDWANNTDPDLAGYNVYRSTTSVSGYTQINTSLVSTSAYLDTTAVNDTNYFYIVTAVDTTGNESGDSNEASATPTGSGGTSPGVLFLTVQNNGTVGGLSVANEDILTFDGLNYRLFFDGSAFGLGGPSGGFTTDAVAVLQNGGTTEILLSFAQAGIISGTSLGVIQDADIVKFTVTGFAADGSVASGFWSMYFDGSDVGLSSSNFSANSAEGIDAIELLSDGRLLLSTHGNVNVPGVSAADEDILVFTPSSLGATTAGSWGLFFDGSDVGLTNNSEDVDGITLTENGDGTVTLYLSTVGNFSVAGVSGTGGDVFVFRPSSLGNTTAGTFDTTLFLDGSAQGLGSNGVSDISFARGTGSLATLGLAGANRIADPGADPGADPATPGIFAAAGVVGTTLDFRPAAIALVAPTGASQLPLNVGVSATFATASALTSSAAPVQTSASIAFSSSVRSTGSAAEPSDEEVDAEGEGRVSPEKGPKDGSVPKRTPPRPTPLPREPGSEAPGEQPREMQRESEWWRLLDLYFSGEGSMTSTGERVESESVPVPMEGDMNAAALGVLSAAFATALVRGTSRQREKDPFAM